MQEILTQLRLKQLYFLLEAVARKGIPVSKSKNYNQIVESSHAILNSFELQPSQQHTELLIRFVYYSDFMDHFMDNALDFLTSMADGASPSENELELQLLEEKSKERFRKLRNLPKTMEHDVVKAYVMEHSEEPITDQEFSDIENGFRLKWKYANVQMLGDGNFKNDICQYLISIDSTIDRAKMERVVDLILQYLQEIRLWGYPME